MRKSNMNQALHIQHKLTLIIVISAIIISGCISRTSEEALSFHAGDYKYRILTEDGERSLRIEGYSGTDMLVAIPKEENNYPVRVISNGCFKGRGIRELIMHSITEIGGEAFFDCSDLAYVHFGSVEKIYSQAFVNCESLESVVFPISLIMIGDNAFSLCSNLKEVYFLSEPQDLGNQIFDPNVTIFGPAGGYLESYAIHNGYTFETLADDFEYVPFFDPKYYQ